MDGETVDPQGVITGGASNGNEANILLKRREIKDLTSETASSRPFPVSCRGIKEARFRTRGLKAAIENYRKRLYSDDIEKGEHGRGA